MKFKIDENLPVDCALLLKEVQHDAETVYTEGLQGQADSVLASECQKEERILITLDRGFGNPTAYLPSRHPGFIILAPHRQDKNTILGLLRQIIPLLESTPLYHRLWIVQEQRIRIRGNDPD